MSDLFRLLSLFYACDVAAETEFPTPQEWARCMGHYHAIKMHFAADLSGPTAQIEGYRRWKEWEAENAIVVAQLRERVR